MRNDLEAEVHHRNRLPHRGRALLRSAALSGCLAFAVVLASGLPAFSDATTQTSPSLHMVGFVQSGNLTAANGKPPDATDSIDVLGVDSVLGVAAIFDLTTRTLFRLSTATLTQTGTAIATSFPPSTDQGGQYGATLVDSALHRAYIGRAVTRNNLCITPQLACSSNSPVAVPASIDAIDLKTGTSTIVELPHDFDGFDVIGLTPVTTPAGRHLLMALLYLNAGGTGESANVHGLQLVALDADRMTAEPTTALVWSYAVPQCMSTPTWTVAHTQDYLGVDPAGRFAYFACRGLDDTTSLDTEQPPGAIVVDFPAPFPTVSATDGFRTTLHAFGAQSTFAISGGDEPRGLLFLASTGAPDKVYVFDAVHRAWVGSVPFAQGAHGGDIEAVLTDASTGEAYGIYPQDYAVSFDATTVPVEQGTRPAYGDFYPTGGTAALDPQTHRLFLARTSGTPFHHLDGSTYPADFRLAVFRDTRPREPQPVAADPDANTHDIPITDGTPLTYRAFGSGYGTRATVVGGIHSTSAYSIQVGDSPGAGGAANAACNLSSNNLCLAVPALTDGDRTVTAARVTNTELSDSAAKSDASSLTIDTTTNNDAKGVQSYNPGDLVQKPDGLKPPPPPSPPAEVNDARDQATAPVNQQKAPAQCLDFGDKSGTSSTPGATAVCDSKGQQAQGTAASPDVLTDTPLQVAYSGVSVEASQQDGHSVTRAVAAARGISIAIPGGPSVQIGEVLTTATTVAGGRPGSATSVFRREISDVVVRNAAGEVTTSCGFATADAAEGSTDACDPRQLTDAVSAQAEFPVLFLTPEPDQSPRVVGSPGGAQAEVIKSPFERVNDYITNGDDGVEIPGLQVILLADHHQPSRLVLQFAGLHAESHYEIGVAPPPPPVLAAPSLQLTLLDDATPPAPLSGATFSVTGPAGTGPLSCATAADGIGTCAFTKLKPGSYTVKETTAPPGFAPIEDYETTLEPGSDYKISFVNLPAIGSVRLTLAAPGSDALPLADALFAMFTGASVLDTPLATCTTDAKGECGFDHVPLGDYTMQQVTAPEGYLVSDEVKFSLTKPKQIAALHFVDGVPGKPPVPPTVILGTPPVPPKVIPGKPAVPPKVIPGKPAVPPRTMVLPAVGGTGQAALGLEPAAYDNGDGLAPVVASQPSDAMGPLQLGPGGLTGVSKRLAQLVVHSPQQAVLLLFVWLVLGMPVYLWVRRRQFITAIEGI
jgi:hypothetical protein